MAERDLSAALQALRKQNAALNAQRDTQQHQQRLELRTRVAEHEALASQIRSLELKEAELKAQIQSQSTNKESNDNPQATTEDRMQRNAATITLLQTFADYLQAGIPYHQRSRLEALDGARTALEKGVISSSDAQLQLAHWLTEEEEWNRALRFERFELAAPSWSQPQLVDGFFLGTGMVVYKTLTGKAGMVLRTPKKTWHEETPLWEQTYTELAAMTEGGVKAGWCTLDLPEELKR